MTEEVWMPVPSYSGVMASSLGRIMLPVRIQAMPRGGFKTVRPKPRYGSVCKADRFSTCEYMNIVSRQFGNIKVHFAVCEAFHGKKPEWAECVMHLDEDGKNNRPENLSWGTQKQNLNFRGFKKYCGSVVRRKMAGEIVNENRIREEKRRQYARIQDGLFRSCSP